MDRQIAMFFDGYANELSNIDALPLGVAQSLFDKLGIMRGRLRNNSVQNTAWRVKFADVTDRLLTRLTDFPEWKPNLPTNIKHIALCAAPTPNFTVGEWCFTKDIVLSLYSLAKAIKSDTAELLTIKPDIDIDYQKLCEPLSGVSVKIVDSYAKYFSEHAKDIDLLVLHNYVLYEWEYSAIYKENNPDGKILILADYNSGFIQTFPFSTPICDIIKMGYCAPDIPNTIGEMCSFADVFTTSSVKCRDIANADADFQNVCYLLPNGFHNFTGKPVSVDVKQKKNVILTVGRLGTEQKNNQELLNGFAQAVKYPQLDGWELRLVGNISDETNLQGFLTEYFEKYPELKQRVTFTGAINDRDAIYAEYRQAKIFALTSLMEGGTPNVCSEALAHGCFFITSDIPVARQITDNGRLGYEYKRGDIVGLAVKIITAAAYLSDENNISAHFAATKGYLDREFDWDKNINKTLALL
jgi:glycosyltransferase involved in cell wall biosynthesis